MKSYAFGVDLGGTTIKIGLFKTTGKLLKKWEIPTNIQDNGNNILADIAFALSEELKIEGLSFGEVKGVGIGVPGAVRHENYVNPCVNLNGWGGNVASDIQKMIGVPVKLINDANAAALGEMWKGGAKGYKNVVFVTIGTGVGGGIIVNGKIVTGSHGSAGEIGHIKVYTEEKQRCGCGKRGCLEQYASATGIIRLTKNELKKDNEQSSLKAIKKIDCRNLFSAFSEGDIVASRMVNYMANKLGQALADISCVCDPEIIVIGGGVSNAGEPLLKEIQKAFKSYAFPAAEETKFSLATLGNDAGIYGSVKIIIQSKQ